MAAFLAVLLLHILLIIAGFESKQSSITTGRPAVVTAFSLSPSSTTASKPRPRNNSSGNNSNNKHKVVIVGGGVGGLAIAARIASSNSNSNGKKHASCEVTILEKNEQVGGRCGSFFVPHPATKEKNGTTTFFRHERGPSLLLLPHIYRELFEECSSSSSSSGSGSNGTEKKTAKDYGLEMLPCSPAYQAVFEDGDCIDVGFPKQQLEHQPDGGQTKEAISALETASRNKMDELETNGASKWDDYMAACQAFLDCGLPNFIQERLDVLSFPSFLYHALKDSAKAWPLKPHSDVLEAFFPESPKLRALASFQDLYVGLEPYRNDYNGDNESDKDTPWWLKVGGGVMDTTAAAVFGLLAAIELHPTNSKCGVYAPIGGFQAVTDAMERLCLDHGVQIHCGQTVTKVTNDGVYYCATNNKDSDNSATDDKNNNNRFDPADLVIVNADLPYAQATLLSSSKSSSDNSKNHPSSSSSRSTDPKVGESVKAAPIRYDWNDRYRFSSGVIAFHWSLNQSLDFLNTHNVFLTAGTSEDAKQSWDVLRRGSSSSSSSSRDDDIDDDFWTTGRDKNVNNDDYTEPRYPPFNFYVHRPTKTDPTAAPKGCDSLLVLVPCPILFRDPTCASLPKDEAIKKYRTAQFQDSVIDRVRSAVLHRMAVTINKADGERCISVEELQHSILDEVVDTPATYADSWNVGAGTPFALSHGFGQLSLTRPSSKGSSLLQSPPPPPPPTQVDNDKPNVLYVGASSRPGNGVPLVLIGAKLAAETAADHLWNENSSEME